MAAEPKRWDRVVAANTFLPTGEQPLGKAFEKWQVFSQQVPVFEMGPLIARGCARPLTPEVLSRFDKPFLTLFGDSDKITLGAEQVLQALVPGARGQRHAVLEKAGHYLQEDVGEVLAQRVIDFIEGR